MTTQRVREVHGFRVEKFESVDSTQLLLRQRLAEGVAVDGAVVRAERQSAGTGRRGTPWSSDLGGSYQSLALGVGGLPRSSPTVSGSSRPSPAPGDSPRPPGRLTLALGLGIARVLVAAGARVSVKWPNDLMLGNRKLGGVIVELVGQTLIVGVGVNVENAVPPGAAALAGWDVDAVGDMVLEGVRDGLAELSVTPESFVEHFSAVDWLAGRVVTVSGAVVAGPSADTERSDGESIVSGEAIGVAPDGGLRLRAPDGSTLVVVGGHVNLHVDLDVDLREDLDVDDLREDLERP